MRLRGPFGVGLYILGEGFVEKGGGIFWSARKEAGERGSAKKGPDRGKASQSKLGLIGLDRASVAVLEGTLALQNSPAAETWKTGVATGRKLEGGTLSPLCHRLDHPSSLVPRAAKTTGKKGASVIFYRAPRAPLPLFVILSNEERRLERQAAPPDRGDTA